ncbi:DUF1488 family protein [Roseibium marinum]|uniref:Uncharacterized protein DUF1488 n=1 Tax=Roseibium marinum TaxID=281252 RepID=A0A2S3UWM4_9HYPH|nr:DUF1488 family protein [Roseibium marinum]POF32118.1 uncharacterized protein DUF1488 [Roseibium marinum]
MALNFPNQSRSFDPGRQSVRFTGYDGVFEISIFVQVDLLKTMTAKPLSDETLSLAAFDGVRDAVERQARKAYSRRRGATLILTAADIK